jgi:hypothetical protein
MTTSRPNVLAISSALMMASSGLEHHHTSMLSLNVLYVLLAVGQVAPHGAGLAATRAAHPERRVPREPGRLKSLVPIPHRREDEPQVTHVGGLLDARFILIAAS